VERASLARPTLSGAHDRALATADKLSSSSSSIAWCGGLLEYCPKSESHSRSGLRALVLPKIVLVLVVVLVLDSLVWRSVGVLRQVRIALAWRVEGSSCASKIVLVLVTQPNQYPGGIAACPT
jgi:hypothetical protein